MAVITLEDADILLFFSQLAKNFSMGSVALSFHFYAEICT